MDPMIALELLRAGNQRFVAHTVSLTSLLSATQRATYVHEQRPIAIILGCSDARAPAEMIFDQGLGSLFIVRVAGNVVSPVPLGSIEFAAERFGTRLVIVMGHTHCGAIEAAFDRVAEGEGERAPPLRPTGNVDDVVARVLPAAHSACELHGHESPEAQRRAATYLNVRNATALLRHASPVLERLIPEGGLLVVGAVYDLETGVVDFFDGVPG